MSILKKNPSNEFSEQAQPLSEPEEIIVIEEYDVPKQVKIPLKEKIMMGPLDKYERYSK